MQLKKTGGPSCGPLVLFGGVEFAFDLMIFWVAIMDG